MGPDEARRRAHGILLHGKQQGSARRSSGSLARRHVSEVFREGLRARILTAAGDFLVGLIFEGETHGLEATEPKGAPQERRRVSRRFDFGSGSASDRRPAVPGIPPRATL